MAGFWESVRELLARIFGGSEQARKQRENDAERERLEAERRDCVDTREQMKQEIDRLEEQERQTRQKHDAASGNKKPVLFDEWKEILNRLNLLRGKRVAINEKIATIDLALSKLSELAPELAPVTSDNLDRIAIDAQENNALRQESARAKAQLEKENYEPPGAQTEADKQTSQSREQETSIEDLPPELAEQAKLLEPPKEKKLVEPEEA